jgi:hypothetical protein
VREEATGLSWYPVSLISGISGVKRVEVTTVDQPTGEYPKDGGLVEMEASGFYPTALRSSTMEFCQVVKVVSDDPAHSASAIDKHLVSGLCEASLVSLSPWLEAFGAILEEEVRIQEDPPGFAEWLLMARFSETQQFQLKKLLRQWQALEPNRVPNGEDLPAGPIKASQCLAALRALVRELSRHSLRCGPDDAGR